MLKIVGHEKELDILHCSNVQSLKQFGMLPFHSPFNPLLTPGKLTLSRGFLFAPTP